MSDEEISNARQAKAFLDGEGDRWFQRNKDGALAQAHFHDTETIKRVLRAFKASIRDILEIGCSNGVKLHDLTTYFGATGHGVDPSAAAIDNGRKVFSELRLAVGTASKLPHSDAAFDLVFLGFCLCYVDRNEIFRVVAEANRVLRSGGFLAILDFDPNRRYKRPYHHKPGLFTYKTSNADFFTTGGHYCLIAKESFSLVAEHFEPDPDQRISISVLYKEPEPY